MLGGCIVCGASGRRCASRRLHTVEQLQAVTMEILCHHFQQEDQRQISTLALRSLLDEVCVTPKPGLVDRVNSGSHKDMDIFTFTASASALSPYLSRCVALGQQTKELSPDETFARLRRTGIQAEQDMFQATGELTPTKVPFLPWALSAVQLADFGTPNSPVGTSPRFSICAHR